MIAPFIVGVLIFGALLAAWAGNPCLYGVLVFVACWIALGNSSRRTP